MDNKYKGLSNKELRQLKHVKRKEREFLKKKKIIFRRANPYPSNRK